MRFTTGRGTPLVRYLVHDIIENISSIVGQILIEVYHPQAVLLSKTVQKE